ncbi:MFS transporter [Stutzerimonas kirkiae]|uniref:MFS transporter n=1 Tax=Stutzerimonas kirkiae TaxID=2211392 RepID=A0A4Q9QY42_9GAMM|nr:MFS transporter [Stutzerimonas kirkiae]TBU90064.1 MFS transporter [Stutzerimonas kirkiae]TBU99076.1 MFS transporter [Stutzerimonas kirkiae]TBV10189.1 MFS transporter [Stutzerimonas kirkiae]
MTSPTPRSTWALLLSLYTLQTLGLGFFIVGLVAILRDQGDSLERISLIYLLGMISALKFLWAPLLDRFGSRRAGHYRGWLLLTQAALLATLLVLAGLDTRTQFPLLYTLCLLVALLSSTHDIAADALVCRLVPSAERGLANGLQMAGGLLGYLIGGGLVLAAYPLLGWRGSMLALLAVALATLLQTLLFREPRWPQRPHSSLRLLLRVVSFWRQPGGLRWLLTLMLYPIGLALGYALITPSLIDAGWSLARIGLLSNILGPLLGILSALLSGWLMRRLGRRQAMLAAALLQVPAVAALAVPVLGSASELAIAGAIGLFFLCYNPTMVVLSTLMMDHASMEHPGTDYTLQFSAYTFLSHAMATLGTLLAAQIGYAGVLLLALLATLPGILLAWTQRPAAHPKSIDVGSRTNPTTPESRETSP